MTASLPTERAPGVRSILVLLVFAGLAGSLGEAAVILSARAVLDRYTLFNPQGLLLAPIATAGVIAIPLLLGWVLGRRRSPAMGFAAAAGVAATLAALEPFLVLKDRLHPIALLAVAVGLGVQVGRLVLARPGSALRLLNVATAGLLAITLAGASWYNLSRALREKRTTDALPAAPEGAPNVLLLVLDTVRALSLSAYGYERPTTPFLEELAGRGARFDRAMSTAPWTLPSHASMFTGRYPHELSAAWSVPLDDEFPTLAEVMTGSGYATAGVAANLRYCSYEFGVARGFTRYRDYDVSVSEMLRSSALSRELIMTIAGWVDAEPGLGRQFADRINSRFLSWIDDRPPDRPFFAFLNYYDAHGPYAPPAPFDTLFLGRRAVVRDPGLAQYTPTELSELRTAYDASIAYLDSRLRALFEELDRRGALRNTIVIVTADHGEEFNEHGVMNHGGSLYFPSVHVPLFIVWPGQIPAGSVIAAPVTHRDLPATILDLTRAAPVDTLPGTSLAAHWQSTDPVREDSPRLTEVDFAENLPGGTPVSLGSMKALAGDGLRYIRRGDGHEELFDIARDPWESRNLATDSAHATRLRALRSQVERIPSRGGAGPNGRGGAGAGGGGRPR